MRDRLEQRLRELRAEFEKGEQNLNVLEAQAANVRQSLLRISGAIQVLEEELGRADQPQRGGPSSSEGDTMAPGAGQPTSHGAVRG